LLLQAKLIHAQNLLTVPESIVFDTARNRYLVSNAKVGSGNIVQIDSVGNQSYFTNDLNFSCGLHIVGNTVYVARCDQGGLVGYDLTTAERVMNLNIPGMLFLNDVTSDTSGYLYITDSNARKIFQVQISNGASKTYANLNYTYPNGILFDRKNNRLLVCYGQANAPIQAVDLKDGSVSTIIITGLSYLDGLTEDDQGNIYVSSNGLNSVFRYDHEFKNPPQVVSSGHRTPADIYYNKQDHVLAVPSLNSTIVEFIPMPSVYLSQKIAATPQTGHAPVTIQFEDQSFAHPKTTIWAWDFDNDGTIDSNDENPTWTYALLGKYNVRLESSNDTLIQSKIFEDFIHIFDGESALSFDGEIGEASCPANPNLNLTEAVTMEAWIKPSGWGSMQNMGFGRVVDKKNISLFLNRQGGSLSSHSLAVWLATENGSPGFSNSPENTINLDEWQHVATTYDESSSTVKIYINGIEQMVSQASGQLSGSISDNSAVDLRIGSGATPFIFDGAIDEVRIWNIVRGGEEIQANMNHYLTGNEPGLVGYWQMNEGSGEIISDGTGNQNYGTIDQASWIQGINLEAPTQVKDQTDLSNIKPSSFSLNQNYPNPFNSTTTFTFNLPKAAVLDLNIYDINGRLVKSLANQKRFDAGNFSFNWTGTNDEGNSVSSGVYFYTLETGEFHNTKKLVLLK